jgi:hypothetical protein
MIMRVASPEREMLAAALRVASKQYEIDAIVLSLRDLANRITRATDLIIVEP